MPINSRSDLLQEQIGQHKLSEWIARWEPLPNAFTESHTDLRHVVGLFRTVLDGETKYIVRAMEQPGGIAKGLRRIIGPPQTGNRGYGAQQIRKHSEQLKVEILRVGDEHNPSAVIKKLKIMMVKYYDPEWAWPFKKRMEAIRTGKIKA